MSTLVHTEVIDLTNVIQLCNVLFNEIAITKLSQQTRYKILLALGKIIDTYSSELQRSKINFIEGFIHCMDGEKDPRNLIVAFALVRAIIERFDISRHIEDLFDVVFCYFPIHFAAPNDSTLEITTEDLKLSLRQCLSATPYFAYYATPLLIEKLLSTTGSAKRDTMETISLCAPAYGAHAILPHVHDLFDALTKEVYMGTDAAMVHVALDTIHNVVSTLGTGISIANIRDPVEKSIDTLLAQCIERLKEPELKNARSSAFILRAVASASDPACTSVTHAVLPIIYQEYKPTDPPQRRKAVLNILTELLIASKKLYGSVEDVGYDRDFQTPLLMYKQQILQVFVLSLIDPDTILQQASLKGIHEMVLMKQFLNKEEMNITVSHLTRQLGNEDGHIRNLCMTTLRIISKLLPESIAEHTVPAVLCELADQTHGLGNYQGALAAIQTLGVHPALFKIIICPLLEKLNYACSHIGQDNSVYCHELAACILAIYQATKKECVDIGHRKILPFVLNGCISSMIQSKWYLDDHLIETYAIMLAITTRLLQISDQKELIDNIWKVFVYGQYENQVYEQIKITSKTSHLAAQLFTAIVGNCHKNVQLPVGDITEFLNTLLEAALDSDFALSTTLSKTVAVIVNKWMNEQMLNYIYQATQQRLSPLLHEIDLNKKKTGFNIFIWLIKALVMRGHPYGFELLDSVVIQQCGSIDMGKDAAACFTILLHDDDFILCKSAHANISILYKQRVFNHCSNTFIRKSESADPQWPEFQTNYLLALLYMLQKVPSQAIINELPKLMMPIILSLSSHDVNLIVLTLKVTQDMIPNAQATIVQHLGSFIHALLRLTRFPDVQVRLLALDILFRLAQKGKSDILSPFRPSVVKELTSALDDKKRIVRKHAVDCREKWFAIKK
ncbi:ARM repeat-containing protein [Rhizopus microsporus ATCC 52813]|uniref:MMS19 nucleotide excision repair protein n=1 Tax=Rhizopus microsporus ATCC 52813 TaxID=1340429 RepID=A0A2G4T1B8_RHIZD|nr:ARM repeat-containing protein [Rhizopus microsporus ATCC 52813]PHZ14794.1 ARM repeat-containing protein [Rhizopus microsporus ATCC 52813]